MPLTHTPPQATRRGLTPSAAEVLLHYHYQCEPFPRHSAPAVVQAREELLILRAIEPCDDNRRAIPLEVEVDELHTLFRTTALGTAWVEAMCATPMPIRIDPPDAKRVDTKLTHVTRMPMQFNHNTGMISIASEGNVRFVAQVVSHAGAGSFSKGDLADGNFIADAFNVFVEYGQSPRQLALFHARMKSARPEGYTPEIVEALWEVVELRNELIAEARAFANGEDYATAAGRPA